MLINSIMICECTSKELIDSNKIIKSFLVSNPYNISIELFNILGS